MGKILIEELPSSALGTGKLYFTDDTPTVRNKTTNAMKIRAMSDEELAEFLIDHHGYPCKYCIGCHVECHEGLAEWLKSEAKEEN